MNFLCLRSSESILNGPQIALRRRSTKCKSEGYCSVDLGWTAWHSENVRIRELISRPGRFTQVPFSLGKIYFPLYRHTASLHGNVRDK